MILLIWESFRSSTLILDSVLPFLGPLCRYPPSLPPPIVSGPWMRSWSKVYLRILGQLDFKINVLVIHALCELFPIWQEIAARYATHRNVFTFTLWENVISVSLLCIRTYPVITQVFIDFVYFETFYRTFIALFWQTWSLPSPVICLGKLLGDLSILEPTWDEGGKKATFLRKL